MGLSDSQADDLKKLWKGKIIWNCSMGRYATLGVGGPADAVVFANTVEELQDLFQWINKNNIPKYIVGKGSNILVPDAGLQGVVIMFGQGFATVETTKEDEESAEVKAGAGCGLARLTKHCTENGFAGLEFMTGIPGSVGGSIVMNAGCWGKQISDALISVTSINEEGKLKTIAHADINFSYRTWGGEKKTVVLAGSFLLKRDSSEEINKRCHAYRKRRQQSQPQHVTSAGSFFKNPEGHSAGKLIEDAGLKGVRIGGAEVSIAHANFIVNTGNATARDILKLMDKVQTTVYKQSGIMLEPEVHIFPTHSDCN